MADETATDEGTGEWSDFDRMGPEFVESSDSQDSSPQSEGESGNPPEDGGDGADENGTPDQPDQSNQPTLQDDGSVRLPDGTTLTAEQIQEWASSSQSQSQPAESETLVQLREQLQQLQQRLDGSQKASQPATLDPVTQPQDWLLARRDAYVRAGQSEVTFQQLQLDLAQAQNHVLMERMNTHQQQFQQLQQDLELQRHEREIESELGRLAEKYPNVQGELGEEILEMALARAAAQGERDLEKVVRHVHELVPRLVTQWANSKKQTLRAVSSNMPRGGSQRRPPAKDYGNDLGSLDRMMDDYSKGR